MLVLTNQLLFLREDKILMPEEGQSNATNTKPNLKQGFKRQSLAWHLNMKCLSPRIWRKLWNFNLAGK